MARKKFLAAGLRRQRATTAPTSGFCEKFQRYGSIVGFFSPSTDAARHRFDISWALSVDLLRHGIDPIRSSTARAADALNREGSIHRVHQTGVKPLQNRIQNFVLRIVERFNVVGGGACHNVTSLLFNKIGDAASQRCDGRAELPPLCPPFCLATDFVPLRHGESRNNRTDGSDCLHPCRPVSGPRSWHPVGAKNKDQKCRIGCDKDCLRSRSHISDTAQLYRSVQRQAARQSRGGEG